VSGPGSAPLVGLETEYAIRFSPAQGAPRPGNDVIYQAIVKALGQLVVLRAAGGLGDVQRRYFLENGGSISYEFYPWAAGDGLVEGATPECHGAAEAIVYQRAQDRLLERAAPIAARMLAADGYPGTLGLLKNCRDAEGHVYGAQENYEVEIAPGLWRLAWWSGLIALVPAILLATLGQWLVVVALIVVFVPWAIVSGLADRPLAEPDPRVVERVVRAVSWPQTASLLALTQWVAFRRERRALSAFLASRPILSGAGTLLDDGRFVLSEKAPSINSVIRTRVDPKQRSVFEVGNLVKAVLRVPLQPDLADWRGLFRKHQRLQLGLADSNMCETAEALRVGSTALLLRMAADGALDDAPQVDVLAALAAWTSDPSLRAAVPTRDHGVCTALDVQSWYAERARAWLDARPDPSLDDHQIITLWLDQLADLRRAPSSTIGRLDWPTKRWLIDHAGSSASHAVSKRVDIGYHELGTGYFAELDAALATPRLVDEGAVARACREPPTSGPARLRGESVRAFASDVNARFDWESVRTGPPILGTILRFDPTRRRRRDRDPEG
jgi:proteasome accessory factor A